MVIVPERLLRHDFCVRNVKIWLHYESLHDMISMYK